MLKINTNKTIAVFLGPSLPVNEAKKILNANYFPPVKLGDVYQLINTSIEHIVIIDGYFDATTPVWHREILSALESGKKVYGASSMGALRAVELNMYGMQGYGEIFKWYQSGMIDGDDEVSLLHASEEFAYTKISEPLVNIRYNLHRACQFDLLSKKAMDESIGVMKASYFGDRTVCSLRKQLKLLNVLSDPLDEFLSNDFQDLKALDAEGLLKALASGNAISSHVINDNVQWLQRDNSSLQLLSNMELVYKAIMLEDGSVIANRVLLDNLKKKWSDYHNELITVIESFYLLDNFKDDFFDAYRDDEKLNVAVNQIMNSTKENFDKESNDFLQSNGFQQEEWQHQLVQKQSVNSIIKGLAISNIEDIKHLTSFLEAKPSLSHHCFAVYYNTKLKPNELASKVYLLNRWANNNGYELPEEYSEVMREQWSLLENKFERDQIKITSLLNELQLIKCLDMIKHASWLIAVGPSFLGYNFDALLAVFNHLKLHDRVSELR